MRALRPLLYTQLLLLSAAASALLAPPLHYQNVRRPATQQQGLVMNAAGERPIPELVDVYELGALVAYKGWKVDVMVAESRWASGHDITSKLEIMRRKQRLHEGERSDVMLEVLDGVKQGLTYDGWKLDVMVAEFRWSMGQDITSIQEIMRREQRLHDSRQ